MIIGNNSNNNNRNFIKCNNTDFNHGFHPVNRNVNNSVTQPLNTMPYKDINNSTEMADRSFEMLQQRYNNGLISLEEYTKKCEQLHKQSQNY